MLRIPASHAREVRRRGRARVRLVALTRDGRGRSVRLRVGFTIYETLPTLE